MATPTTEFVYLTARPTVRPEDADNEEGKALIRLLTELKSTYTTLIWSRSVDKDEIIGIGVGTYMMPNFHRVLCP